MSDNLNSFVALNSSYSTVHTFCSVKRLNEYGQRRI